MRDDAYHVWAEPGRRGKSRKRSDQKHNRSRELWKNYPGDAPKRTSIRDHKHRGGYSGSQIESWNPLRRFLLKSVGRHWDKVYSEICKAFRKDCNGTPPSKAVFWWVERHVFMVKGKPFVEFGYSNGVRRQPLVWGKKAHLCLYVHPKTGQLLKAPRRPPKWWKPKG